MPIKTMIVAKQEHPNFLSAVSEENGEGQPDIRVIIDLSIPIAIQRLSDLFNQFCIVVQN